MNLSSKDVSELLEEAVSSQVLTMRAGHRKVSKSIQRGPTELRFVFFFLTPSVITTQQIILVTLWRRHNVTSHCTDTGETGCDMILCTVHL